MSYAGCLVDVIVEGVDTGGPTSTSLGHVKKSFLSAKEADLFVVSW